MLILGLNAYHGDAAACLVHDGEIVAAIEEERLRRIKHWSGFPSLEIALPLKSRSKNNSRALVFITDSS